MLAGVTPEQYWNGDYSMLKYYRESYKEKLKQQSDYDNYLAWLHGLYIYEALCDASPVFNPFSKRGKAYEYPKKPHGLSDAKTDQSTDKKVTGDDKAKQMFEIWAISQNAKFERKQRGEQ